MKRLFTLGLAIFAFGLTKEAYMSDIVGASKTFGGFSFAVSRVNPSFLPGGPSEERTGHTNDSVRTELEEFSPIAEKMVRHYLGGKHPFPKFTASINTKDASGKKSDQGGTIGLETGKISFFFNKGTSEPVRQKTQIDFLLSQLAPGGSVPEKWSGELESYRKAGPDVGQVEYLLQSGVPFDSPDTLYLSVTNWYLHQEAIAGIAAGSIPLGRAGKTIEESPESHRPENQALIRASAKILDSVLRDKPYPDSMYSDLLATDPALVPKQLEAAIFMAPSKSIDATLNRVDRFLAENPSLVPGDAALRTLTRSLRR